MSQNFDLPIYHPPPTNQSNLWWYFDPVNWWLRGSGQKTDTFAWIRLLLKVGLNAIYCVFHFYEINVLSLIPQFARQFV